MQGSPSDAASSSLGTEERASAAQHQLTGRVAVALAGHGWQEAWNFVEPPLDMASIGGSPEEQRASELVAARRALPLLPAWVLHVVVDLVGVDRSLAPHMAGRGAALTLQLTVAWWY